MSKGAKVEIASPAKCSDVLFKSECGVHDDAETSDLLRELDLSVSNNSTLYRKQMMEIGI